MRLHYLSVHHYQVDHREDFENNTVLQSEVGDRFEDDNALLFFVFGGDLFCELERDAVPQVAHVVAVEHEHVGVLDVEFDVGHVLDADEVLVRVVLHHVLALQGLVLLLQALG